MPRRTARRRPLEDGATLASVARQVGYATEYAFAAAFKREVGQAPGRWRARQHGTAPADPSAPAAAVL